MLRETCPPVSEISPISTELNRIAANLQMLSETIKAVEDKFSPVLHTDKEREEVASKSPSGSISARGSTITVFLTNTTMALDGAIVRLTMLLNRCEL